MWGVMGDKIETMDEVLYRQIHPNSLHNGEPGSDRFRPSEADKNMLSVDRSSVTSASDSHALYVSSGRLSAAVFGVSVGEFGLHSISCVEDRVLAAPAIPASPGVPAVPAVTANPAHALADYSSHTDSAQKNVAKKLKRLAVTRGCLFQA